MRTTRSLEYKSVQGYVWESQPRFSHKDFYKNVTTRVPNSLILSRSSHEGGVVTFRVKLNFHGYNLST